MPRSWRSGAMPLVSDDRRCPQCAARTGQHEPACPFGVVCAGLLAWSRPQERRILDELVGLTGQLVIAASTAGDTRGHPSHEREVVRVAGDSAGTETAGGLFLLAWGLFATTGGVVTNYRGFAERFVTLSHESVSGLRRLPPWRWMPGSSASWVGVGFLRLLGIPFAVLGPVVLIAGIVLTAQGRFTQPNLEPPPLPFQAIGAVIFLTGVVALWIRNGFLSTAWRRGGSSAHRQTTSRLTQAPTHADRPAPPASSPPPRPAGQHNQSRHRSATR